MFRLSSNNTDLLNWEQSMIGGNLTNQKSALHIFNTWSFDGTRKTPKFFYIFETQKYNVRDFPGGAVVKNPPANAGDTGSIPGPERSHMPQSNQARVPQLLSLCSRAHTPQLLSPCATTTEARMPTARAPQQEKPPQ